MASTQDIWARKHVSTQGCKHAITRRQHVRTPSTWTSEHASTPSTRLSRLLTRCWITQDSKISGKKKILGESKNLVEAQPSTQYSFPKWTFRKGGRILSKSRYQSFLIFFSFAWFCWFCKTSCRGLWMKNFEIVT